MPSITAEGFSLSHAAILDGSTGAEEALGDLYGVREASIAADQGNYDNTGDDAVLSSWFWINYGTVTVKSGYVSFDLISLLTGEDVTTSGSSPNDGYSLPLWTIGSLNQPRRPMLIRMPSKDADGNIRNMDIVLYSVQFSPLSFEGPTYKTGLVIDYTGRALISSKDEVGNTLSGNSRGIGRILNNPVS